MRPAPLTTKTLAAYAPVVGDDVIDEIETLAKPLRGARVAHVSATAQGGGVAELLHALTPLMRDAGLNADWYVITGTDEFFAITKGIHNALQGMPLDLTPAMKETYLEVNFENAASFDGHYDFVVVHDPQPAPLRAMRPKDEGQWIWRCHIDLTSSSQAYWDFMRPFLDAYDAAIFTMPQFAAPDLRVGTVAIIPPAIDPLSPKNARLPDERVSALVSARHVDPTRPILTQVSRFDPWKDPVGVIEVYRAVSQRVPAVQLALLGALARDDPEGEHYYQRTLEAAGNDPNIHVLMNVGGSVEVNAFQRRAAVVLQKSLREGFGLTVTEGLWKSRPVVASRVGGIPLQITDGETGYLVEGVDETVERVLEILQDPDEAEEIGMRGHEAVRRTFLTTANLINYLKLFNELEARGSLMR
jgi:trehalose synthase